MNLGTYTSMAQGNLVPNSCGPINWMALRCRYLWSKGIWSGHLGQRRSTNTHESTGMQLHASDLLRRNSRESCASDFMDHKRPSQESAEAQRNEQN